MGSIAIYARASIDRKEQRISVDRQLDRCRALANTTWPDADVVVFEDNNLSASNPDIDRPGYKRLLASIRAGHVDQVVSHEQSRLTRHPGQWDELVVTLTKAGIREVHTVLKGTIPVAPGNRVVGRVMAAIDANESEVVRLRALAAHEHLALQGRPNGGRYYGYQLQYTRDGRPELVIDEKEAIVVRRIVDGLMAGKSSFQVANELNADNIPTGRTGRRWWGQTVLGVARRPHIAGLRTHRGQIVGTAAWEPIVDRDRWELLAGRIDSRRGTNATPRKWLLSGGLAVCGICGCPLVVGKVGRSHGYVSSYTCSKRSWNTGTCGRVSVAPAELVEQLVAGAALDVFESGRMAKAVLAGGDTDRAKLGEQLAAAEARVARAAELFGAGEIDELTWRRMHAPAAQALAEARARLERIAGPVGVDLPGWGRLRAEWDGLTVAQKRAALGVVIERVTVGPATGRRPRDHEQRVRERTSITWRL